MGAAVEKVQEQVAAFRVGDDHGCFRQGELEVLGVAQVSQEKAGPACSPLLNVMHVKNPLGEPLVENPRLDLIRELASGQFLLQVRHGPRSQGNPPDCGRQGQSGTGHGESEDGAQEPPSAYACGLQGDDFAIGSQATNGHQQPGQHAQGYGPHQFAGEHAQEQAGHLSPGDVLLGQQLAQAEHFRGHQDEQEHPEPQPGVADNLGEDVAVEQSHRQQAGNILRYRFQPAKF